MRKITCSFHPLVSAKGPAALKISLVCATLVASLCLAAPAVADEASHNTAIFSEFDLNKDGRLSAGEICERNEAEIINSLDRDKNGWISLSEFATKAAGSSLTVQGGIDQRNVERRWIGYTFIRFELGQKRTITSHISEGQYPIDPKATDAQIETAKAYLISRFYLAWPITESQTPLAGS